MDEDKKKDESFNKLVAILRSDGFAIAICIVALLVSGWTYYTVEDYIKYVNDEWSRQWDEKCMCGSNYIVPQTKYDWRGKYNDSGIQNTSGEWIGGSNTQGIEYNSP